MDNLYDHAIFRHLWQLGDFPSAQERVEAAARAYEDGTGSHLQRPLSGPSRRQVARWLSTEERASDSVPLLSRYGKRLESLIYLDLADKVVRLSQSYCFECVRAAEVEPASVSFPIQIRPFSAQSMNADGLRKLKKAISEHLAGRNLRFHEWAGYDICVSIVGVVPESTQKIDVDNMAKGLLDAMQGSLYQNDRQVQHLNIRRIQHGGDESHYSVRAQPVLDPREDVLDPRLSLSIVHAPIRIE